jgi:hypothetical protein
MNGERRLTICAERFAKVAEESLMIGKDVVEMQEDSCCDTGVVVKGPGKCGRQVARPHLRTTLGNVLGILSEMPGVDGDGRENALAKP